MEYKTNNSLEEHIGEEKLPGFLEVGYYFAKKNMISASSKAWGATKYMGNALWQFTAYLMPEDIRNKMLSAEQIHNEKVSEIEGISMLSPLVISPIVAYNLTEDLGLVICAGLAELAQLTLRITIIKKENPSRLPGHVVPCAVYYTGKMLLTSPKKATAAAKKSYEQKQLEVLHAKRKQERIVQESGQLSHPPLEHRLEGALSHVEGLEIPDET